MLKEWQFNILFFVGVGGAVFLLVGPEFGLNIADNPTALAGVGSILTYILTQKKTLTKPHLPLTKRRESPAIENNEEKDDVSEQPPNARPRPNVRERGDEE